MDTDVGMMGPMVGGPEGSKSYVNIAVYSWSLHVVKSIQAWGFQC